jgi:hypothetical protein
MTGEGVLTEIQFGEEDAISIITSNFNNCRRETVMRYLEGWKSFERKRNRGSVTLPNTLFLLSGVPTGSRTPVTGVKGRKNSFYPDLSWFILSFLI